MIIQPTGSLTAGGGGGMSNFIEICGTTVLSAADGDIIGGIIVLPIELCCFSGYVDDNGYVKLKWETLSELNNRGFWIEKSIDGVAWEEIHFVSGAGAISTRQYYNYTDSTQIRSVVYYRLKQTDFDGKVEIFEPIAVNGSFVIASNELYVFPNPVNQEEITVYVNSLGRQELTCNILDMNGNLIFSELVPVVNNEYCKVILPFDIASGNYLLNVGSAVSKLVVLR